MVNHSPDKKIIKNNAVVNDSYLFVTDTNITEIPSGKVIIPLASWNRLYEIINKREELPGLLLNSDENPADFIGNIASLQIIAVHFPAFTDGRGFSIGNLLRERYGFKGELRAYGEIIRDQLYYLKRCGFDAFAFNKDIDLQVALKSLNDFSNDYQVSSNQYTPLFRRRSTSI